MTNSLVWPLHYPKAGKGESAALTPAQSLLRKRVLDSVVSPHSKRNYRELLLEWRAGMESLSPSTINVRLSAMRKMESGTVFRLFIPLEVR
jgi:hypothetical protein